MFKSKKREIVVEQREHARLAGMLAQMWGNDAFDSPRLPIASFIAGVCFHDRGYDALDTDPIPDVDEATWIEKQLRGAERSCKDADADLLVTFHVRRLLASKRSPARDAAVAKVEERISQRLPESSLSRAQLEWCDRITHLCDSIAFTFCFEQAEQGEVLVCPRWDSEETERIRYSVLGNGEVLVSPWPFSTPKFSRYVIAYQASGYPENREAVILPVHLRAGP